MSHEINANDHVALAKGRAWHGLGTIVPETFTPREGLTLAKLDWTVEQAPLKTMINGVETEIDSHVMNYRSDTQELFGIVGSGFKIFQNEELADFCECLAKEGDQVRVETCGSIRDGRKLWFLLAGESFSVRTKRDEDEVKPYICVSNGHDGSAALRCTPTTVRVVCSNTLHAVIPHFDKESGSMSRLDSACYVARHCGDLQAKVEEARNALGLYSESLPVLRELIDTTAQKDVLEADVQQFFVEAYSHAFGPIIKNPKDAKQAREREKALVAGQRFNEIFQREEQRFGASAWTALNAYTGWLQHDRPIRRKDEAAKQETRNRNRLFGKDAARTTHALQLAVTM